MTENSNGMSLWSRFRANPQIITNSLYGSGIIFAGVGCLYYCMKSKPDNNKEFIWKEPSHTNRFIQTMSNLFDFLCIDYPLMLQYSSIMGLCCGNFKTKLISIPTAIIIPFIHNKLYFKHKNSSFYHRIRRIYLLHSKSSIRWMFVYNTIFIGCYSALSLSQILKCMNSVDHYTSNPSLQAGHWLWDEYKPTFDQDPVQNIKLQFMFWKWVFTRLGSIIFAFASRHTLLRLCSPYFKRFFFGLDEMNGDKASSIKTKQIKIDLLIDYDKTRILPNEMILNICEYAYGENVTAKNMITEILYEFMEKYFEFVPLKYGKTKVIWKTMEFEEMIDGMDGEEKKFWKSVWIKLSVIGMESVTKEEYEEKARRILCKRYIEWHAESVSRFHWQARSILIFDLCFLLADLVE